MATTIIFCHLRIKREVWYHATVDSGLKESLHEQNECHIRSDVLRVTLLRKWWFPTIQEYARSKNDWCLFQAFLKVGGPLWQKKNKKKGRRKSVASQCMICCHHSTVRVHYVLLSKSVHTSLRIHVAPYLQNCMLAKNFKPSILFTRSNMLRM